MRWSLPAAGRYPGPNALTETSSAGSREPREPPGAVKAASRPVGEDPPEHGEERRPQAGGLPHAPSACPRDRAGTRPPHRRARLIGGGESAVAPRVPFSPALPRGRRAHPGRSAMISRVLAGDLPAHVGEQVRIAGWLHRRRELKSVTFLIVRDRSGLSQVVLSGLTQREGTADRGLPEETVVEVTGTVVANDQAPGGVELTGPRITALSGPAAPPPFDLYRPTV